MQKKFLSFLMMMLLIGCQSKPVQDDLLQKLEPYSFSAKENKAMKETQCLEKETIDILLLNKEAIDKEYGL